MELKCENLFDLRLDKGLTKVFNINLWDLSQ